MKQLLFGLALLGSLVFGSLVGSSVPAFADSLLKTDACAGLSSVDSTQGCGSGSNNVYNILSSVVSILSLVVGVVAVIMIILAGLRYITAAGDSGGISSAKNTLIYALVGLVVAASAQFLVHFVFNRFAK